jgi:Domain of unknown function (DUF1330)
LKYLCLATRNPEKKHHAEGLLGQRVSTVKDPDKLAAYAKLAGPALTAGGRFLARGEPAQNGRN